MGLTKMIEVFEIFYDEGERSPVHEGQARPFATRAIIFRNGDRHEGLQDTEHAIRMDVEYHLEG